MLLLPIRLLSIRLMLSRLHEGDEVKVGDTVVVLEAMKMANNLTAEKAGKVTAILVKPGQSVMEDDPLICIQ